MIQGLIYKHTSMKSGKSYIGKTKVETDVRFNQHCNEANRGSNCHFHKAIRKYGKDDFITEVLFEKIPFASDINLKCELSSLYEAAFIELYNTYTQGYNMTLGGEGTLGNSLSKEHKEKISKRMLGKVVVKDKNNIVYQVNTNDNRYLNGEFVGVMSGVTLSKEHKEKISPLGRKHSEETKRKIGTKHKGKVVSEETKEKQRNHKKSNKHKKNMSISAKNRIKIKCPYCDVVGISSNMNRWHFDNCKLKGAL